MNSTKVLLADDHAIVAQGLELLLKDSFNLVGTVRDGRALVEAATRLRPDVIVADISMLPLNGLDAVRQLKSNGVEAKVVILHNARGSTPGCRRVSRRSFRIRVEELCRRRVDPGDSGDFCKAEPT